MAHKDVTKDGGQGYPVNEWQKEGYDEAAHGGKNVRPQDVGIPLNPGEEAGGDAFDREAREAANDVRREDTSAD